ncbi:hypothetical protein BSL82_09195 [Tardibacter chloracetimidivorans]|uniref:YokE-like PH domain-containing protein n=1 Tax=Tardibacter chloracetimidivorans TaxID=1921510 RepID=A0A1L3ZV04_9SPHN|nr:PH domain-containing protein [Tardibacter chloracetimidivorans]API59463.1 hypothetical protein BSL82_09195 [Tardibacter chloracetimidivorans]
MPTHQEISDQIKTFNIANAWLVQSEIRELPAILEENEQIIAAIQGASNRQNGLLVATKRRLMFLHKGLVRLAVKHFALDQITSIEFTSGLAFGEISIFTSGHKTTINRLAAAETRPFVEAVRQLTSPIFSGQLPSTSHANLVHFERVGSSQPPEPAVLEREVEQSVGHESVPESKSEEQTLALTRTAQRKDKKEQQNPEAGAKRTVGLPLTAGIALLPVVFAWFLLRQGHSTTARLIGFGWAFVWGLAYASSLNNTPTPGSEPNAVTRSVTREPLTAAAAPGDEDKQHIASRPGLSGAAKRMKLLYEELDGFRRNPEFLRVGFSSCCRYHRWKLNVEELDRRSGSALFQELNITAGDLLQLGQEYALKGGANTPLAQSLSSRIEQAVSPTSPRSGGGRAKEEGWWCRDVETWFASMRANEAGEYAKAASMVYEPACSHVLPNSTTGPELERRYYNFADGVTRAGFVRVRLTGGVEVWAPLDAIEFQP